MNVRSTCGYFIVIEGADGAGTTTQSKILTRSLLDLGAPCVWTCEPSSPIPMCDWREMALLFAADRSDHLLRDILPHLSQGVSVVCDRYIPSSLLYQSLCAPDFHEAFQWVESINSIFLRPDLTIILDVDAQETKKRRSIRAGADHPFEEDAFQEKVASLYKDFCCEGIVHVDGSYSESEVSSVILDICLDHIGSRV